MILCTRHTRHLFPNWIYRNASQRQNKKIYMEKWEAIKSEIKKNHIQVTDTHAKWLFYALQTEIKNVISCSIWMKDFLIWDHEWIIEFAIYNTCADACERMSRSLRLFKFPIFILNQRLGNDMTNMKYH